MAALWVFLKSNEIGRYLFVHSFSCPLFLRRGPQGGSLGGLEIPHGYQQSPIVQLAPYQELTKQGLVTPFGPWSISVPFSRESSQQDVPRQSFWSRGRTNVSRTSRFGGVAQDSELCQFHSCAHLVVNRHTVNFRQNSNSAACTEDTTLSVTSKARDHRWRSEKRPNAVTYCFSTFSSLQLCDHRTMKFTQNYICFTNPCINLLVLSSVTREYHPKILELFGLLQCIAVYVLPPPNWIFGEREYLGDFSAGFHSCLAARHLKRLRACWRPYSEDTSSTKPSAKGKLLILKLRAITSLMIWSLTVYPRRLELLVETP